MLTFKNLRIANVERCEHSFGNKIEEWSPTDWGCALAGEAGELCNKLKKMRRGESVPLKDVADEIADTVIYCDLLAERLGINLDEAVISKFNEVTHRRGLFPMVLLTEQGCPHIDPDPSTV